MLFNTKSEKHFSLKPLVQVSYSQLVLALHNHSTSNSILLLKFPNFV